MIHLTLLADHQSNRNTEHCNIVSGVTGASGLPDNWLSFRCILPLLTWQASKSLLLVSVYTANSYCAEQCDSEVML